MSSSTRTEAMCLTSHLSSVPIVDCEIELETATKSFLFLLATVLNIETGQYVIFFGVKFMAL